MNCSLKYPYLWELSSGKLDFIKVMLTTFVQSAEEYKTELSMAMAGSEKDISLVAHKVKSAAKIVNAIQLAEELELLQKNPNAKSIPAIKDKIEALVESIQKDMELL